MTRLKWMALLVLGLAAALPLTGCGGGGGIDAASPAAFCHTLKQQRSDPNGLFSGLSLAPAFSDSMPSADAVKVVNRVIGLIQRLDAEAPPAVKPAMDTFLTLLQRLQSDYQQHGTTVGQVIVYMRQHPPTVQGGKAAERSLSQFARNTCHISP